MSDFDDFENYDNDWGDDPFEGDMDFDSDFDNPGSKKGFFASVGSGFLDGIIDRTIGSTESKIHTLQRILPESWNPTFRNLRDFNQRRIEIMDELKNDNFQTIQDLQYLAERAAKASFGKLPNKISEGLSGFSKYDFSSWEKKEYSSDNDNDMEETTSEEIAALVNSEDANSILGREVAKSIGKQTIGMMTEIGGRTIGGMHQIANVGIRSNQLLEHLLDFQRRVQQRNDQLMINLTARNYLTASKYYKFQEASNHRIVAELKNIVAYVKLSDYEKTSTSDALKRNIRETVFNSVKSKFGGIADYVTEKFGKDAREDISSNAQEISSSLRMVAEMTEGMPINVGSMLGNAAAGIFLNNLPRMINSERGQAYLAKFKKQFPKLSKWADDAYIRFSDLGHVATYVTGNTEELVNTLAKHHQGSFGDDYETYEDYLDTVPKGEKPLIKAQWMLMKSMRNKFNSTTGTIFEDMWESSGTTYSLSQRSLEDGHEQAFWSRKSERALTEEIPRWFSMLHLSLEKMRTGNDALKPLSYDYKRDRFITSKQKVALVTNAIYDKNQFSTQASNAVNLAKSIAGDNVLSKEAQEAFAMQLVKDSDRKLGFNPYNYFSLEDEGHSKKISEEIAKVIKDTLGITDKHIDEFLNGDDATRTRMVGYMPTEKARRLMPGFADASRTLATFMPDIINNLDVYKASGYYDAMKEAGIITPSEWGGGDDISDKKFFEILKRFIADPESKITMPMPEDMPPDPTLRRGTDQPAPPPIPPYIIGGSAFPPGGNREPIPVKVEKFEDLLSSLGDLKDIARNLDLGGEAFKNLSSLNFTPIETKMDTLVKNSGDLLQLAMARNETLTKIQEGLPKRKKANQDEENDMRSGTNRIIDKIKEFSFKDFYNKAVDTVLRNEPLILGGLLGGLAGYALHNPKAAALIGAGAIAATAYGKFRSFAKARNPEDTEDLYEEGSDTPILEASRLRDGQYYDLTKKAIIKKWSEIVGSVRIVSTDAYNGTIIGARKLAGKLFTAENKEVFLSGLSKIRDLAVKAFNWMDPWNRFVNAKDKVVKRFFQMDVYKEGADAPTLIGKSFEGGAYYKRGPGGKAIMLTGWNEIDGPVYDRDGNVLITQEDYDRGLVTSMGVSINKLGKLGKRLGGWGLDIFKVTKDKVAEYSGKAVDKSKEIFSADYSPIVDSVDRIYHLLLSHWGYQVGHLPPDMTPPPEGMDPNKGIDPDTPGPTKEEVERREEEDQNPTQEKKRSFHEKIKDKLAQTISGEKEQKPGRIDSLREQHSKRKKDKSKPETKEETRLNSIKDQQEKKKQKKIDARDDAIIDISNSLKGDPKKPDAKKGGLFGLIGTLLGGTFSVLTGLATFFTKTMWNGFKIMGTLAKVGIRVLPMMLTGIEAVAKGIFTLIQTKSITSAGSSVLDTIMDNKKEHPKVREKRKKDREEHRKKPSTKLKKAGIGLGLGMVAGSVADNLVENGVVEEDGLVDNVMGVVETAGTIYGGYQLASGAAALMGVELGAGLATAGGVVGTVAMQAGLMVGRLALGALMNPYVLGAIAIGAAGYGLYKLFQAGKGSQIKLRLTQYGISDVESDLAENVIKAEQMLEKFVVIGNGRASISKDAPITEVFKLFIKDPRSKAEVAEVFTWFNGRFKPVFLTYMACIDASGKFKTFEEYDKAETQDVYNIAKQAHSALSSVMPFPYSIVSKLDKETPLLGEQQTIIRVNNYLEDLKKYVDRKTPEEDKAPIATPGGLKLLEKEKAKIEGQLKDAGLTGLDGPVKTRLQQRLDYIDKQLEGQNTSFKLGKQVQAVYIKDLLPDDRAMDLLTAIRIACYGNDEDINWRVEAVLRLERYCEPLFVMSGKEVVFNGDIPELFKTFRTAFRLKRDEGEEWCVWFRDRFAPVMRNYVQVLNNYRKGNPGVVWKSLSTTARYEIAQALVQTQVYLFDSITTSIWNVRASPFLGTKSPDKPDRVDRMLKVLGEASNQAKLRDPEKEAGKTNTQSWAKAIAPHKPGGGLSEHAANVQPMDEYKTRKDIALGGTYGTNTNRGAGTGNIYSIGGAYGTPQNQYGYKALTGDSDTSHLDMSKVMKDTSNKDSGVKIPRKLAEQLIIREMLKQGFTDPRMIAEVLALSNYETGGYTRTVENMKYSDPQRLLKLFKEVTTLQQAQQLVAAGPVAIGNTVYGGAKGKSLGNNEDGDGYKFRGRGLFQHTGKSNYEQLSQALGIDLVSNPEKLSEDPNIMAAAAVEFFKKSKLLQSIGDDGNFGRAARGLNGGNALPGMDDRYKLYLSYLDQLGKGELKADEESAASASQDTVGSPGISTSGSSATGSGSGASTPPAGNGPMLGGPNGAPPLGASGSGGSLDQSGGGDYTTPPTSNKSGGGLYSGDYGNTNTGGFAMNSPSNNEGLRLKSTETTAGGDCHPAVKRLGQLIQTNVRTFKQITALNDAWHKRKKPGSKHAQGLALDFTLTDGARSSDYAANVATQLLRQAGLQSNEFLVLNEYKRMSAGATGGHIHVGFNSVAAADKFAAASGAGVTNNQDTTAGGGPVQPVEEEMSGPPQMGVEAEEPRGMESPAGGEGASPSAPKGKPNIPGAKPPQSNNGGNSAPGNTMDPTFDTGPGAQQQQRGGGYNPPNRNQPQQQAPQVQPADNGAVEKALEDLLQAINTTGGAQTELLRQAVGALQEISKSSKDSPMKLTV